MVVIGLGNGLLPGQCQARILTYADKLNIDNASVTYHAAAIWSPYGSAVYGL